MGRSLRLDVGPKGRPIHCGMSAARLPQQRVKRERRDRTTLAGRFARQVTR